MSTYHLENTVSFNNESDYSATLQDHQWHLYTLISRVLQVYKSELLLRVSSKSFSMWLLEVMTLHLTTLLLRLFIRSIISATKGLTSNAELLFSVLVNPSFESMRNGSAW